MRFVSADCVYPVDQEPISDGVIAINDDLSIEKVGQRKDFGSVDIKMYSGIILPGFVNTHCHLELSHLKDRIPSGTGLLEFIKQVVALRESDPAFILNQISHWDQEMYNKGISAIGDISNKTDSFAAKESSQIYYHTFVEMFDFIQESLTQQFINQYEEVYSTFITSTKNKASRVPHAPYTVSQKLLKHIAKHTSNEDIISVHNQETPAEDELLKFKTGPLVKTMQNFGFASLDFKPGWSNSTEYVLQTISPKVNTLLVHNTMTTSKDIRQAIDRSKNVYWATCANANLYIENRLPDYKNFIDNEAVMTIGTDSLSSNWQLSVWEEIKTIKKYNAWIDLEKLIKWGTLNGAKALKISDTLGSISPGKKPGLVHVDCRWKDGVCDVDKSIEKRII